MAQRSRNRAAFERTVAALRKLGRIEPIDAAMVALGRTLADLLDDTDEPVVQTSWAYRAVVDSLMGREVPGGAGDDLAAALAALSAQMGDAPES